MDSAPQQQLQQQDTTSSSPPPPPPPPKCLFVRCKHIVKVHDLFHFLADNREALSLTAHIDDVPVVLDDGVSTTRVQLKDGAPLEAAFVSGSRKPFCLLEFTGEEGEARTAALLQLPEDKRLFKTMPVEISVASGDMTVAKARKRNEQHTAQRPVGVTSQQPNNITTGAKRPRDDAAANTKPASAAVQVTSFVPRTVRR